MAYASVPWLRTLPLNGGSRDGIPTVVRGESLCSVLSEQQLIGTAVERSTRAALEGNTMINASIMLANSHARTGAKVIIMIGRGGR